MADRYWVGGTGTWNTSSTTNWSATSGGGSGASVPTVADNVIFDQAGTYTVTMTGALACLDITVSAGTVTFAQGTSPTLEIRGSMTLLAGTVWSSAAVITFSSTATGRTVTTNGTSIAGRIIFNGVGGGWTLGSALTTTSAAASLAILAGTFDTSSAGNYSITCGTFTSNGVLARTLNLNASTITFAVGVSGSVFNMTNTSITFNAGTSTFTTPSTGAVCDCAGLTYYNFIFTNISAGTHTINGANTFNNLSVAAPSSAGVRGITFDSQQTINGTLSTTGTAGNRRVFFASATYGISVDLVVNSAPSLTDADFRGLYVRGTSAPISGTRIGNRGECRGITFSTPKTVYWNLAGAQNWSGNGWAATSTGSPSTDNFPLPQDTATFTNAGSVTGTITLDTAIAYVPNVDMSGRTTAMTLGTSNATTVYGNWTNGSGTAFTGTATLTFSGGTTQTITSAGKTFSGGITIDTYGGTVQLADALNIGSNTLTVTNGTFTTAGYAVTALSLVSNNSNIRTITLGASTLTLTNDGGNGVSVAASTNLTVNAGTSQINFTGASGGGLATSTTVPISFYNLSFTGNSAPSILFSGGFTCNNLTFTAPSTNVLSTILFFANATINGTLTCAGATAVRRIFLRSDTIGTPRTITAAAISATDCDFRDINLAGAASGASPTRAGNCGGNTGITFPAAKTVYWNLAGAQNWSATGWAPGSGGTPDINNFPLAQDTAVFDNTGSVTGTITINAAWNIGTFDASLRTSAMTLSTSANAVVYSDWKFGTGVTSSSTTGTINFVKNGTQTITSNGVQFGCPVTINHPSGTVQLADALSLGATRAVTLTVGTFDAVTYNVTAGSFSNGSTTNTLRMGSGTWTLSGTATVWNTATLPIMFAGTSTIVLSDTTTAARSFAGGAGYFNKLTIGGATGISTLTINGNNTFGELASTKTVAHGVRFVFNTAQTIGKWSITGTVGNVVIVDTTSAGSTFSLTIAGPANSGIDYLSVRDCTVATTSPGEFYVGTNSTNVSGNTRVIFTATPAARTLYWVGGTGNWSSTTKWSTSSGGASGAAIPTSLDAVIFDSASNATAYTATIDAGVTLARCASFTMAGPLVGNVTFAGSVGIAFHGSVSFAATGITISWAGSASWAGNSSYTFTTNGQAFVSTSTVIGIGSTWTLGSALNVGTNTFTVTYGTFSTSASNYAITAGSFSSNNLNIRSIILNGSTVTLAGNVTFTTTTNLTFNAGTSSISVSTTGPTFAGGGLTFNNFSFTSAAATSIDILGVNTFNTLSFSGRTSVGISSVTFSANQTITTLTLNAGTAAAYRTFLASDTIGTQRTLSVGTLTAGAADYDFRDIAITGAAAPLTGTRFGDGKGNSGITFPAAKTVYYRQTGSANWGATGTGSWSATSGGGFDATQFPLAQDTAIFPAATYPASGSTTTVNANYNIGTIDMNLRTANTMTLATSTNTPSIYGNWINGTGTTLSGTGNMTFAGRGSQTITSAGKTFTQNLTINTPSGSVTLQDAFALSGSFSHLAGTFDAATYNFTSSNTGSLAIASSGASTRTLAFGSGTWVSAGQGNPAISINASGLTVTGTGTISLTNASAKTFAGGGISYSGITLNQGGAGALTITGNNTFKTITNTYSATGATSIALGATTQTLTNPWTATGAATRVLTVSGTSAASPGTLIFSGAGTAANVDYLTVSNVRAYDLVDEWYAGPNSTNGGSLGWYFVAAGGTVYAATITETGTGTDSILAGFFYLGTVSELATSTDVFAAAARFNGVISESGSGSDIISAQSAFGGIILESATITDTNLARLIARATLVESATINDVTAAFKAYLAEIIEAASGTDTLNTNATLNSSVDETAIAQEIVRGFMVAAVSITESASGADQISALRALAAAVVETATVTDSLSAQAIFRGILQEIATLTDSVNAPGSTYSAPIIELATLQDVVRAAATFPASLTETATGTQTNSAAFIPSAQVFETATITDVNSALVAFAARVAENAVITDQVSPPGSIYNPVVLAVAQLVDSVSPAGSIYNAPVLESAAITDALIGAFLWNLIDDSQNPNWANITDSQTPGWVEVGTSQGTGWVTIPTPQNPGWSNIDDSQPPNWQNITNV